ncbi:addiction module antidote protein [Nitrospirillum viridazoti]|uniref:Putative addiction module antidote protein n=1 Tax=Nitrospirillum viridazoti CBAmc TaxID=1441467 RepID=A0A248JT26_9PROT|nr:addiction module antidote protein [Nitrospirillum amazonense]ASG21394.1 putative addiction module antidote protein [Nitrospirillum amazonense CBAmc]TWB33071.1 putative addiction module antidote protein [Nitrospirillum amazonense]
MSNNTSEWRKFDAADFLETDEDVAEFLNAAIEEGDPQLFRVALQDVARAKGMTELAQIADMPRGTLYKALSPETKTGFDTILRILQALNLSFTIRHAKA